MTSTPANLASTSAAASDDVAALVIAFVARETGMATEAAHGFYVLCDESRENVDYVRKKFKEEFDVDMSEFDYNLAFPPSPPGNGWSLLGVIFSSLMLAMPASFLLWTKLGLGVGLASFLPLLIASIFLFLISVLIIALMWSFLRRSGQRDLWRYPDNAATVQTLIDSARAKRWTYRAEKATP
jgi:hypothetical protein